MHGLRTGGRLDDGDDAATTRATRRPAPAACPARSADRAFDILEYLSRRTQPASSGTIGLECGIPKSSLHNLLKLMKKRRLVTHHPHDKTWSLGPRVSELTPEAPLLVHALAVLRAFSGSAGALTVREHRRQRSELPQSVVQRIIPVMEEADLLWVQPDGSYRLGLELFSLAAQVAWVDRLRVLSRPVLTQLRDSTRETANLAVMDGDQAIYVEQVESRQALRYGGWLGRRIPIEGTALGAALRDPSHGAHQGRRRRGGRDGHRLRHRGHLSARRREPARPELAHRALGRGLRRAPRGRRRPAARRAADLRAQRGTGHGEPAGLPAGLRP